MDEFSVVCLKMAAVKTQKSKERLEKSNLNFKRETLPYGSPSTFVNRSRQLLKEVEEKRLKLKMYLASDLRPDQTSEYYNLVDSLAEDEDALEVLRIRRLVRESIKATEKEVKDYVEKVLSNELVQESALHKQELKRKNPVQKDQSLGSKILVPGRAKPTMKRNEQIPRTMHLFRRQISEKESSTVSLPTIPKNVVCGAEKNVLDCQKKGPIFSSKSSMEKVQKIHPSLMKNSKITSATDILRRRNKFFPCALPLAPPSRQRPVENIIDAIETINIPRQEKVVPSLTNQSNVSVIRIVAEKPLEKQLTCQILPSLDIVGKPTRSPLQNNTRIITIQAEDEGIQNDGSEYPGNFHINPLTTHPKTLAETKDFHPNEINQLSQMFNGVHSTSNRLNPALLAQIINAVNSTRAEMDSTHETEPSVNRTLVENLIVDIVHENLQKISSSKNDNKIKEVTESNSSKMCSMADKQTQSSIENAHQTANVLVEHESSLPSPSVLNEEPSKHLIVLNDIGIQTDLQVVTETCVNNKDIVFQPSAFDINHKDGHYTCTLQEKIIPEFGDNRTSTPLSQFEEENVPRISDTRKTPAPSTTEDPIDLEIVASSVNEEQCHVPQVPLLQTSRIEAEMKDVSIQFNTEDQCLNNIPALPEMKEVAVQFTPVKPSINNSTMTIDIGKTDAAMQYSPLENVPPNTGSPTTVEKLDVAVQIDFLDQSLSSTTVSNVTTISDNEFMDDLISEGEIHLPWNLRLLSLIEKGMGSSSFIVSPMQNESTERENEEYSLSEGEIPPRFLFVHEVLSAHSLGSNWQQCNNENLLDLIPEKLIPETSSESFTSSPGLISKDVSEGQIVNPSLLKFSSDASSDFLVSSGEEQLCTESEIVNNDVFSPGQIVLQVPDQHNTFTHFSSHGSESFGFVVGPDVIRTKQPSSVEGNLMENNEFIIENDHSHYNNIDNETVLHNPVQNISENVEKNVALHCNQDVPHTGDFQATNLSAYLSGLSNLHTINEEDASASSGPDIISLLPGEGKHSNNLSKESICSAETP